MRLYGGQGSWETAEQQGGDQEGLGYRTGKTGQIVRRQMYRSKNRGPESKDMEGRGCARIDTEADQRKIHAQMPTDCLEPGGCP